MTKVTSRAVIEFLEDGSITLELSSASGVTARKLDVVHNMLFHKLNAIRAEERRRGSTLATSGKEPVSTEIAKEQVTTKPEEKSKGILGFLKTRSK